MNDYFIFTLVLAREREAGGLLSSMPDELTYILIDMSIYLMQWKTYIALGIILLRWSAARSARFLPTVK